MLPRVTHATHSRLSVLTSCTEAPYAAAIASGTATSFDTATTLSATSAHAASEKVALRRIELSARSNTVALKSSHVMPAMPSDTATIGVRVGLGVGRGVGVGLGAHVAGVGWDVLGTGVGTSVGAGAGTGVGAGIGTAVGVGIGTAVGDTVGAGIGTAVGVGIGTAVGEAVGAGVGTTVGVGIGKAVGEGVGRVLGRALGRDVGVCVGASVGNPETVGEVVGWSKTSPTATQK